MNYEVQQDQHEVEPSQVEEPGWAESGPGLELGLAEAHTPVWEAVWAMTVTTPGPDWEKSPGGQGWV